jgi:hypothetical protein
MTISKLIEQLQQYPSDMEVLVDVPRMGGCYMSPTIQKVFIGSSQKDCLVLSGIVKTYEPLKNQIKK